MSRRHFVYVLVVLSVAAFATAFVLIHGMGHQTLRGSVSDPTDPDAPTEDTQVQVECASPASGPRLNDQGSGTDMGDLEGADGVAEDDGYNLDREGIDTGDAYDMCERVRVERLAHAGELGVLGLVLAGSAVLVVQGGRRHRPEPRRPA